MLITKSLDSEITFLWRGIIHGFFTFSSCEKIFFFRIRWSLYESFVISVSFDTSEASLKMDFQSLCFFQFNNGGPSFGSDSIKKSVQIIMRKIDLKVCWFIKFKFRVVFNFDRNNRNSIKVGSAFEVQILDTFPNCLELSQLHTIQSHKHFPGLFGEVSINWEFLDGFSSFIMKIRCFYARSQKGIFSIHFIFVRIALLPTIRLFASIFYI